MDLTHKELYENLCKLNAGQADLRGIVFRKCFYKVFLSCLAVNDFKNALLYLYVFVYE